MQHLPLLSQNCERCTHPFATVCPRARFCSDECRIQGWKEERKRSALVDALMTFFKLADGERARLMAVVRRWLTRFCQFAEALGFKYHTKKYTWRTS